MKENLDQHLFREDKENHYSPSCFMTTDNSGMIVTKHHLGIDVGGSVIVKSLSEWHQLADKTPQPPQENTPLFTDKEGNSCYIQHYSAATQSNDEKLLGIDIGGGCVRVSSLEFWYNSVDQLSEARKLIDKLRKEIDTQKRNYNADMFEDLKNNDNLPDLSDKPKLEEKPHKLPYFTKFFKDLNKPQEYCDQCGNTGFSLFDGKKCVHKSTYSSVTMKDLEEVGEKLSKEFNEVPNVHINKGLDVNIQDQPIPEQIKYYQRRITNAWHKLLKLIRESEEK